jgi:hypothetical protein
MAATPLPVTADDAARSELMRTEIATMLLDGATIGVGGPVAVDGIFGPAEFATSPKGSLDQAEALALAVVRSTWNGTTGRPLRNAIYTVGTVPSPAAYTGCTIYVSNGAAGAPVLAFSNGVNWLRCDTLAAIS